MNYQEQFSSVIESAIAQLDINPEETRCEEKGQWLIYNGETEIYIDLWELPSDNGWIYFQAEKDLPVIQVSSPVCFLPEKEKDKMIEELLNNNLNLINASFVINSSANMLIVNCRTLADNLTSEQIIDAIERIGYYSASTFFALSERFDIQRITPEVEKK